MNSENVYKKYKTGIRTSRTLQNGYHTLNISAAFTFSGVRSTDADESQIALLNLLSHFRYFCVRISIFTTSTRVSSVHKICSMDLLAQLMMDIYFCAKHRVLCRFFFFTASIYSWNTQKRTPGLYLNPLSIFFPSKCALYLYSYWVHTLSPLVYVANQRKDVTG